MLVYCAGPLDGVSWGEGRDWYEEMAALSPLGWALYCPGLAFKDATEDPRSMDVANRVVISHACDVVIAKLDGPGMGFGTIREIEFARMLGKPVIVIGEIVSLLAHDIKVVDSLEDAVELMKELFEEVEV